MAFNGQKISDFNNADNVQEKSIIPIVTDTTETSSLTISSLRAALNFETAFATIQEGVDNTEKNDIFFVFEDTDRFSVLGFFNQGGGSYSPVLDGNNNQVSFATPGAANSLLKNKRLKEKLVIYAEEYGVKNDSSVDSSDALQAIIDKYKGFRIILPSSFMIKKTIKYYTQTILCGVAETRSVCWAGEGFVGTAMFEPATTTKQSVQEPEFRDLTLAEQTATNVDRGTSSSLNGIELIGTFVAKVENIKGIRLNCTVHCDSGTDTQHTMRPYLRRINGSNVNYHIKFEPAGSSRLAYGDIYLSDIKTSGSCLSGISIRDTDGLQINGAVIFPNGGIEISGHYLNISNVHPFEPKAPLGDTRIPACISIVPRSDTEYSRYINITNVACGFAGRLANTTSNNPPQVNNPAPSIKLDRCQNFNISFTSNNPSQEALVLKDCLEGTFTFTSNEANAQRLGSGKLPAGSFDTVSLLNCQHIIGSFTDDSPGRRYAVYLDDDCQLNHITGVTGQGNTQGQNVRIPTNGNYNYVKVISKSGNGATVFESKKSGPTIITLSDGSTTPSTPNIANNDVIKLNNSVVTNITDFPDIGNYQSITVFIGDNNASRLVDIANGGKFNLGGSNVMGRGTVLRLFREDLTGTFVKY